MTNQEKESAISILMTFINEAEPWDDEQQKKLRAALSSDLDNNQYTLQQCIDSNKGRETTALKRDFPLTIKAIQNGFLDKSMKEIWETSHSEKDYV